MFWRPSHPWELTFPHACKCLISLHRKYQKPLLFSSLAPESMQFGNWVGRQSSPQGETFHNELPTYRMSSLLTLSSQLRSPRTCCLPGASCHINTTQISCIVWLKSLAKGAGFQEVIKWPGELLWLPSLSHTHKQQVRKRANDVSLSFRMSLLTAKCKRMQSALWSKLSSTLCFMNKTHLNQSRPGS